ncbi:MAG: putative membrane protein [Sulfitobacter sp.]|jgi:uncharacterized membrane protein
MPTGIVNKAVVSKVALVVMILGSIAIGMYAVSFQLRLSGSPQFHLRFNDMFVFSSMHVIGGAVVLLVGGFQFVPAIRQNYPQVHRWMGRLYLSFVLIGGIGGLVMAPVSEGGLVAHFGFGVLAVLWLFSGAQAYAAIRRGDVASHKVWMMRNFAMAFGAVNLRVYLGLFAAAGVPFAEAYPVVAWLSWVLNLIVVEWFMVRQAGKKADTLLPSNRMAGAI